MQVANKFGFVLFLPPLFYFLPLFESNFCSLLLDVLINLLNSVLCWVLENTFLFPTEARVVSLGTKPKKVMLSSQPFNQSANERISLDKFVCII